MKTKILTKEQGQEQQADLELITKRREKKDQELKDFTKSLKVLQKLALKKDFKGWINKLAE